MGDQISRPMQIVLLVTVLFALVWFVALRPKAASTSSSSSTTTSVPEAVRTNGIVSAPAKARAAVATADAAATKAGGPSGTPTTSSGPAAPVSGSASATPAGSPAKARQASATAAAAAPKSTAHAGGDARAARALAAHKVLVVLFYNPRAADDRAVRAHLGAIATHGGRVVRLAVPLARLSAYRSVTARVQITESPTVVIFDRAGEPRTLQGFVDPTELDSRIADALTSRPVRDVAPTP